MSREIQPIDRWLHSRFDSELARHRAIELLVGAMFDDWESPLPVDPIVYAEAQGYRVEFGNIPAGRITRDPTDRVIRVPSDLPPFEQRFVIAHELGHLLFAAEFGAELQDAMESGEKNEAEFSQPAGISSDLELFCDIAGRIIVVPRIQLLDLTDDSMEVTIQSLMDLSRRFDVTPATIFRRLVDIGRVLRSTPRVLFFYGPNRFTGQDAKWRVAAQAVPPIKTLDDFRWENRGADRVGLEFPSPAEIASAPHHGSTILNLKGESWILETESSEGAPMWILGKLTRRQERSTAQLSLFPL